MDSQDFQMSLWTFDDNLPSTSVTALAQTPDGYLWVGTQDGLARFDGVRFTRFDPYNTPELPETRISKLFTDTDGTLWINTHSGSLISYSHGQFTSEWNLMPVEVQDCFATSSRVYFSSHDLGILTRPKNRSGPDAWQRINVSRHRSPARYFGQDASGTIWFSLNDGEVGFLKDTNVLYLPKSVFRGMKRVNCLSCDPTGQVWVETENGIYEWNGRGFDDQTPTNGLAGGKFDFLFCTARDGWWTFAGNAVWHAKNRQWVSHNPNWNSLAQTTPLFDKAFEDKQGYIWFRQYENGLFYVRPDETYGRISTEQGLPDNRVECWLEDREGNLWIGMNYGGLGRLRKKVFQTVGGNELNFAPVTTVCEGLTNQIWFGTVDHGLCCWDNGILKTIPLKGDSTKETVFSSCPAPGGKLWISSGREDLFALDSTQVSRVPISAHGIKAMLKDHSGRIWLGCQKDLWSLDKGEWLDYGATNAFPHLEVRALAEDSSGGIWVGTEEGILCQYVNNRFILYQPANDPAGNAIWSLLPMADGSVWVGTFRGGLLRFRDGVFRRYTVHDGFLSDVICQIVDDGLGNLWFGSHNGIFHAPQEAFDLLDRGKIKSIPCVSYGTSDGLPTMESFGAYQPSACRSHDGRLWFATMRGLVVVNPKQLQMNTVPPPVVVEGLLVDGANGPLSNRIIIPPGRHQFQIQFTALSLAAPEKVLFRHQLEGMDEKWSETGSARSAVYGPLTPGVHVFHVTACNNDGVWNQTGATITLVQKPFFWQTWWFAALAVGCSTLLITLAAGHAATLKLQRKLKAMQAQRAIALERERIARDIHDDLGAGLTQIMFQSSLAKSASANQMQSDLTQIACTARDLIRAMDEIVWAVNPENDTLDSLISYLSKYTQDFLQAAHLQCRLDFPASVPDIMIPTEIRHQLYLAIKEVLNNTAKHAKATEVLFRLRLDDMTLAFIVQDDGVGIAQAGANHSELFPSRPSSGNGLRQLPQRIQSIGGDFFCENGFENGTRIKIIIPLRALSLTR